MDQKNYSKEVVRGAVDGLRFALKDFIGVVKIYPVLRKLVRRLPLRDKVTAVRVYSNIIYLNYPLDKEVVAEALKEMRRRGYTHPSWAKEPKKYHSSLVYHYCYRGASIYLKFSEKVEGASCRMVKIGTEKKIVDEPVYDVVCG